MPEKELGGGVAIAAIITGGTLPGPIALSEPSPTSTTVEAAGLLLRSPQWTVSEVLELLDIGDAEFREMLLHNHTLADILERRRQHCVDIHERQCRACGESFLTATFRNYCGAPACRAVATIEKV